jgi:hypothetical protein
VVRSVDRLTGPDLGGFVPEEFGCPAEIGLIAVLEAAPLFDDDGPAAKRGRAG